jgi:hypothetical protein
MVGFAEDADRPVGGAGRLGSKKQVPWHEHVDVCEPIEGNDREPGHAILLWHKENTQTLCKKLDPPFAYAEGFDGTTGSYLGLRRASVTLDQIAATGLLVRPEVVSAQSAASPEPSARTDVADGTASTAGGEQGKLDGGGVPSASGISRPRRFYGSVEIDMVRPIKSLEAVLNAVALELQRTPGAKVTLTLEIEAHAPGGFPESEVGVVRDNARQLRFNAESTGFED